MTRWASSLALHNVRLGSRVKLHTSLLFRSWAFAMVLASGISIGVTWPLFTHTIDEPIHISCGLEWLEASSYTYERQHPPLGRIAAAMGPWLMGSKNVSREDLFPKSPLLLYDSPSYAVTLSAARAGELVFYFWMCWEIWAWSVSLFSPRAAAFAVSLAATTPPLLGHAGLAATDIAVTCLLVAATRRFWMWVTGKRSFKQSASLGVLLALGACSKFTFLAYFPICAIVCLALFRFSGGNLAWRTLMTRGLLVAACAILGVWGMYLFKVDTISSEEGPVGMIRFMPERLQSWIHETPTLSFPLAGYYRGVVDAQIHAYNGHMSFFMGELRRSGWWYFFPVVFAIKTPIPFLLGIVAALWLIRKTTLISLAPLLCGLSVMACVLPATINIGLRHILPIYPLFAIAAGGALHQLANSLRFGRFFVGCICVSQIVIALMTWPDNLSYFNLIAGKAPEAVRVDSDLDWGQDIARFAKWTAEHDITSPVGFAYFGSTNPTNHGLSWYRLSPWQPSTGWLAVSATELKMSDAEPPVGELREPWWWLKGKEPYDRLGGILIFHLAP